MVISKSPKAIVILGLPGSGKGTQAELLSEKLGFFKLETSTLVWSAINQAKKGDYLTIEGEKYFLEEQGKISRKGLIWDGRFTTYFTARKIRELAKEKKSVILSGSPRNLEDAGRTIPLLKKLYGVKNVITLFLEISPQETVRRNKNRRECELARHPVLYNAETAKLTKCPLDGSKLVRRVDDDPKIIIERLKEYKKKTFPVLEAFRKAGIRVQKINGGQPVADVFKDILKELKIKLY